MIDITVQAPFMLFPLLFLYLVSDTLPWHRTSAIKRNQALHHHQHFVTVCELLF